MADLVYSTDGGRMCPRCRKPLAQCRCRAQAHGQTLQQDQPGPGTVRVRRETGGRSGKTVTAVRGLPLAPEPLAALAKRLRSACGAGGTVKDSVVEIQGDHVDRVMALLQAAGFSVKRAGG